MRRCSITIPLLVTASGAGAAAFGWDARVQLGESHTFVISDAAMGTAEAPASVARSCRDQLCAYLGIPGRDIVLTDSRPLAGGRLTVVHMQHYHAGRPVEDGIGRILIRNDGVPTAIFASGRVAPPVELPSQPVPAENARQLVASMPRFAALTEWSLPTQIVWGIRRGGAPRVAWRFVGCSGADAVPEKFTFMVDVGTGVLLEARSEILHADLTGRVFGLATPGTLPDSAANDPAWAALPGLWTHAADGGAAVTSGTGYFRIASVQATETIVTSDVSDAQWVAVHPAAGAVVGAWQLLIPDVPGQLLLNAIPSESQTAQVNTLLYVTRAHDFFRDRSNLFAIDEPLVANVNLSGACNASFDGDALNFYSASSGCRNSAYSTLITHEYGHYIVQQLGLGQGAFGEGFGDAFAMLVCDTPVVGEDFFANGEDMRDPASANRQYPCSGDAHYCGELLAGIWWDMYQNLSASYGAAGREIAAQLFVDWAQITLGGAGPDFQNSAHPLTAVEVLLADDDDFDLSNGTPNYDDICAAFAQHGIACPQRLSLTFEYPNGAPSVVWDEGETIVRVHVSEAMETPSAGTAAIHYRLNGQSEQTMPLRTVGANWYDAVLPTVPCGGDLEFSFSAVTMSGTVATDPPEAPESRYRAVSTSRVTVSIADDAETDRGWALGVAGDTANRGVWERADPEPTSAQPGDGASQVGTRCWVTGAAAGSSASSFDVDNGATTLVSPILNLQGAVDATVSYSRWYSNHTPSMAPQADILTVQVTNDLQNWVTAESIGPDGFETEGGWIYHEFQLRDYVVPTDRVRIRFVASDFGASSTVEAAVDDLKVVALLCEPPCDIPGCKGLDFTGDCVVGVADLAAVLCNYGSAGQVLPGDTEPDGDVDLSDLARVLEAYGRDCEGAG